MQIDKVRYSRYIRPFTYILDLLIINLLALYFFNESFIFNIYISLAWVIIAVNVSFYEVYRYTKPLKILRKIITQYIFFVLVNFVYYGVSSSLIASTLVIKYASITFTVILLVKFFIYYSLKYFRINYGGNYRNIVIVGDKTEKLSDFFIKNPDYGYVVLNNFSSRQLKESDFTDLHKFCTINKVNEIYISISSFTDKEVNKIIIFADNNLIKVKLLMDRKSIFARNLKSDFYGDIPIVSLRNFPLDNINNRIVKRVFDIVFSGLVIIFILSWLTPIVAFFIKKESKGPVFFKQMRNGIGYKEFSCYKFRSMHSNPISDVEQAQKNDPRVTKIGAFLRKSSIDELPQFFNVFLGDMSVVGPRPHMIKHTEMYAKRVDKFMVRHFIKPGITGLAQVSGFRGEIETNKDIIKRVRYDIYYSENWSLLFDIKIVIKTVVNAIKGEEKAY